MKAETETLADVLRDLADLAPDLVDANPNIPISFVVTFPNDMKRWPIDDPDRSLHAQAMIQSACQQYCEARGWRLDVVSDPHLEPFAAIRTDHKRFPVSGRIPLALAIATALRDALDA